MVETSCGILCNSGQKSIDKEKYYIFDADDDGRDGGDNGDDDGRHLEGADQVFAVSASVMEHLVLPRGCLLIALLMPMMMMVMMMVVTVMMVIMVVKLMIIQDLPEKVKALIYLTFF